MKSIYLLCEYGVPYSTAKFLNDNNITIYDIAFDEERLDNIWGKNSKKKIDIVSIIPLILNDHKEETIFSLIDFGLSKGIVSNLFDKNIKIYDIIMMNKEMAKDNYDIGNVVFEKINESISKYLDYKRNIKQEIKNYPNYVFKYIENTYNKEKFKLEDLAIGLKILHYNTNLLELDIKYLLDNNKLNKENEYYYIPYPKLLDQLDLLKEEYRTIILKKLEGRTLESIGNDYGVTRERIRQIISKNFSKLPVLEEDRYHQLFEEYDFDCQTFCEVFSVKKYVYYYLKEKYTKGEKEVIDLLELDTLNEHQKEIIRKKCNIIIYNDEHLVVSKSNILEAILRYKNQQIDIDEIIILYNEFLNKYNLQNELEYLTKESYRNIEGILDRSRNVISSYNRKYRYYEITKLSKEQILNLEELLKLESGIYSTELFINNNQLLIKELDIKDEYELHYILRKLFSENPKLNFTRMPDIGINYSKNRTEFLEEQIKELSPINVDEFVKYMYDNYGYKYDTTRYTLAGSLKNILIIIF